MTGIPVAVLRGLKLVMVRRSRGLLRFFAPPAATGAEGLKRIVIDLKRWRSVMARISNSFSTPLDSLSRMPWDEALRWWPEAQAIHAETWGRQR